MYIYVIKGFYRSKDMHIDRIYADDVVSILDQPILLYIVFPLPSIDTHIEGYQQDMCRWCGIYSGTTDTAIYSISINKYS